MLCRKTTVYLILAGQRINLLISEIILKMFFTDISNNCAPMETRRLKHRNNPWMNSQIIELIYKLDYLKIKAIQMKNEETWLLYRRARNNVTKIRDGYTYNSMSRLSISIAYSFLYIAI